MDSYRAEKKATMAIALPDADAEIEPVPTSGGGRKQEPELDKLSNIVIQFPNSKSGALGTSLAVLERATAISMHLQSQAKFPLCDLLIQPPGLERVSMFGK